MQSASEAGVSRAGEGAFRIIAPAARRDRHTVRPDQLKTGQGFFQLRELDRNPGALAEGPCDFLAAGGIGAQDGETRVIAGAELRGGIVAVVARMRLEPVRGERVNLILDSALVCDFFLP